MHYPIRSLRVINDHQTCILIQILLGKGSNKTSRHEAICLALAAHGQSYRAFLAFFARISQIYFCRCSRSANDIKDCKIVYKIPNHWVEILSELTKISVNLTAAGFIDTIISGIPDFTTPYRRWLEGMRTLEGIDTRTEMAMDIDQVGLHWPPWET